MLHVNPKIKTTRTCSFFTRMVIPDQDACSKLMYNLTKGLYSDAFEKANF